MADAQTCTYGYDDLARIGSVNCGSGFSQTITVGALGNLTKSGTLSFMPGFNTATDQITSAGGQNYTYDKDGNLLSTGMDVGTSTYTWNSWGGMTGDTPYNSTKISITYDALGRIGLEQNGSTYTSFVYGPTGEKLALMNGQTLNRARIALPGGGMAVYDPTGLIRYWHGDWQGSARLLSNPDQTYYSSGAVAPYGESYAENPAGTLSPFAGLISDTSSELNDALYREYDPTQGRWMSPDPAGLAAVDLTNPQSLNRYAYVGNNPTTLTDPSGLHFFQPCTGSGLCNWGDPNLGGGGGCTNDGVTGPCSTLGQNGSSQCTGNVCQHVFCQGGQCAIFGFHPTIDNPSGWQQTTPWSTDGTLPQNGVFSVFQAGAQYMNLDPNAAFTVFYWVRGTTYNVVQAVDASGNPLTMGNFDATMLGNDTAAADPSTFGFIHDNNPSWYVGGLFDPLHLVVGEGAVLGWHTDFGNPTSGFVGLVLHGAIDFVPFLFNSNGTSGTFQCSLNGGCY